MGYKENKNVSHKGWWDMRQQRKKYIYFEEWNKWNKFIQSRDVEIVMGK